MKILKIKLQIFLTGFIIYQVGLLMHKKEQGYEMPTLKPAAAEQHRNGFASPAYASNDFGGMPLDIPYDPYMGSAHSTQGQMQAAAQAEAMHMMQTGDTQEMQRAIRMDPMAAQMFGMR